MNELLQYIHLHPAISTAVACVIISNAVNALPTPYDKSNGFYKWFFVFSHGISVQLGRFVNNKGANGNV